jgi:hypothetical protein
MTTHTAVLEVIAGRKRPTTVYAECNHATLAHVFVTDADLARELIEARKEIERLTRLLEGRKRPAPAESVVYVGEHNPDIDVCFKDARGAENE